MSGSNLPKNVGGSVLGIVYDEGAIIAADTAVYYNSLLTSKIQQRIYKLNDFTVVGLSGDMADAKFLLEELEKIKETEAINNYNQNPLQHNNYFMLLSNYMHMRRTELNPIMVSIVLCGYSNDDLSPHLYYIDYHGTSYEAPFITTGFGAHIAKPVLHKASSSKTLTKQEAYDAIIGCLKLLHYRNSKSLDSFIVAFIEKSGVTIDPIRNIVPDWKIAERK